jgi:conjugative relaxase-like TrwC/TraI family protein
MLRIVPNRSAARAKSYYSTADYYTEGQELQGVWRGEGAARLGLAGNISKDAWDALCDNRDPATDATLTARRKADRRVGYDFNFHVPKSVSLLYSLTKDERILDAFRASVHETMLDIEKEMKGRVRIGGRNEERTTGNMVWGEFVHFTSRPVEGIPDPHLHAHCFVHNLTFDAVEQRWKAGSFADIKRDGPYFEGKFHARMGRRMAELGLGVERTRKGWEIAGLAKSSLDKFSLRTALIEAEAKSKGIRDDKAKDGLGAKTRERKQKDLTFDELRVAWSARLSSSELAAVETMGKKIGGPAIREDTNAAVQAVDRACAHVFERKSVAPEREMLALALKGAVGKASVETVEHEFRARNFVSGERNGRRLVTTPDILLEETHMLDFARKGRGSELALASGARSFKRDWLNEGQKRAVLHVLNSHDRVILVRGAAGVGKTSMMQEAVEGIETGGKKVFTFAPSADASRGVLRKEGFANAETVALFLNDPKLQEAARGQVLWIDEAGLLGTGTMGQVFDLADKLDARVILSGDTGQHGPVERGSALRLLETEAGLVPAEIKEIQRQKGSYKQAVQALRDGRTEDGFRQLDQLGWIKEVEEGERYKALAAEYIATVQEGKTGLIVSPTHLEGEWITDEIRSELRAAGKLGKEQRVFTVLENANLTLGQRSDATNYEPDDVLVFHQNGKGYRKGERLTVGDVVAPLAQAARFQVFHPSTLSLSAGDLIRVTRNGKTLDGHRLNNGAIFTVDGFTPKGDIQLSNGWKIARDFGHLDYGYCITSHASQGRTVDRVFIGQSSQSFPASSREQFYVSVSRGREAVKVFTDEKASLLDAVSHGDDRLTATEFVSMGDRRERHANIERMEASTRIMQQERAGERQSREGMIYDR